MKRVLAALCVAVQVGLVAVALPANAADAKLGELWATLSEGDRSAIKTASARVGSTLQTVKGSPNAKFWDELGTRGLLRSVTLAEIFGEQAEVFAKAGMVAFAVTPEGAKSIPGLVQDLEKP